MKASNEAVRAQLKCVFTFQNRTYMWLRGAALNINHLVSINPLMYIAHQRNGTNLKKLIVATSTEASPSAAASREASGRGYMRGVGGYLFNFIFGGSSQPEYEGMLWSIPNWLYINSAYLMPAYLYINSIYVIL